MPNIRHSFVSAKADSADATIVRPSDWNANLEYTSTSGAPSGADAIVRDTLTADRPYYVRSDGSDSNTGLLNSSAGAFLTIQKAIDTVAALDLSIYSVTIQVSSGTYSRAAFTSPWVGGNTVTLIGDATTPSNVTMSFSSGNGITVTGVRVSVSGVKLLCTGAGNGIVSQYGGSVALSGKCEFSTLTSGYALNTDLGGLIYSAAVDHIISGSMNGFLLADRQSFINYQGGTTTVSSSLSFSDFASAYDGSGMRSFGVTWSSTTVTAGRKYYAEMNSIINTFGGGANYFPGATAGSVATGGQYA